jgi:paraquat-inducible protein B
MPQESALPPANPPPQPPAPPPRPDLPEARIERRRSWTWAWIIPLLALVIAGIFAYQAWTARGPIITVRFEQGVGIAAGDPVSFRGVRVGDITAVNLTPDLKHVAVVARLKRDAAGLARAGSKFWIVRPEISAGRVSGLETILGPRYLEGEPGDGPPATQFTGLDRPWRPGTPGAGDALDLVLELPQRGSLSVDSPILYRGIRVGSVRSLELSGDARTVEAAVAIDPAFRHLIRANSRFWNAGGIGLDWGLIRGLSVKAGSLESVMAGGIAFATPNKPGDPVENGRRFVVVEAPKPEWLEWAPVLEAPSSSPNTAAAGAP